ncbi:LuxR C-terminal-related transcriptional regulator [Streptomyces sp. NPDC060085]|uniref:LuxR C-terminal-related transcriptional regulator n=1 Tax=Streptomyces sp. NPDC060085 TaxID=3347054 RepID=UPI003646F6FC
MADGQAVLSATDSWPFMHQESVDIFDRALNTPGVKGLLIQGLEGIGKSRLAEECCSRASLLGHPVIRVRSTAMASRIAYGAMTHLLPRDIDTRNPIHVYRSLANFQAENAHRNPVILLDDLHFLDDKSAAVISQLFDSSRIFLLATFNLTAQRTALMRHLERREGVRILELGELNRERMSVLLRRRLGADVERSTVDQFYRASRGNMLYLRELVNGARSDKNLRLAGDTWRLHAPLRSTARLRRLIEDRLAIADPNGRNCLDLLAISEPIEIIDLQAMVGRVTLSALEEAGLVCINSNFAALAHPLYGEALRSNMAVLQRRELLAAHVMRRKMEKKEPSSLNVMQQAARQVMTESLDAQLLARAAYLAYETGDYAQVVAFLEEMTETQHTIPTYLLLGESYFLLGHLKHAEHTLRRATEVDMTKQNSEAAVAAARLRMVNLYWSGAPLSQALYIGRVTRNQCQRDLDRYVIQECAAGLVAVSGHPQLGLGLLDSLREVPTGPASKLTAHTMKVLALVTSGKASHALQESDEYERTIHKSPARITLIHQTALDVARIFALTEFGLLEEAEAHAGSAAGQSHPLMTAAWLAFHRGRCAWLAGRYLDAKSHYTRAIAISETAGRTRVLPLAYSGIAAVAAVLGDERVAQEACTNADRCAAEGLLTGEERLGEAWLLARQGRFDQARQIIERAARQAWTAGQNSSAALLLTEMARFGYSKRAKNMLMQYCAENEGPLHSARLAFVTALDSGSAELQLAATNDLLEVGAHGLAAESAALTAAFCTSTGQARQAAAADRLGVAARKQAQLSELPLLVAPVAKAMNQLTQREFEIAARAGRGMSSQTIANELFLSRRTVDNSLQRVYAKLGIHSRRDLLPALSGDSAS